MKVLRGKHQKYSEVTVNKYPVYHDLIFELKLLENRLDLLADEKIEYERQINIFNSEYIVRFGSLVEEILKRRADLFSEKLDPRFEEAQLDYEEFGRIYLQQLQDLPVSLTDDEKQQLKIIYRKASRLCHPDKLADDAKAKGEEIFKALNAAYRNQDLKRLQDIFLKLEAQNTYMVAASERIDDRTILQKKIIILQEHIATLEAEIKCLQENEIYKRIQTITDMNDYFSHLELELQAELEILSE